MPTRTSLLTILGFGLAGCPTSPDPGPPTEGELDVLTYNVHGLPSSITGDDTEARLAAIAPLLAPFDVIGLQEDWIDTNHAVLEAGAGHPTRLWFAEVLDDDRYYGSGLAVLSVLPEVDHRHVHYDTCNGFLDGASDCLASKGVQAVRLELAEGVTFDLYNTHFEAGGGDEDDLAREAQIEVVLDLMNSWSADQPLLFTGDFNLHQGDDPDDAQLARLTGGGGLSDSCEAVACEDPTHIDRVFFRDGGDLTWTVEDWRDLSADFLDDEGVDLSDHPPIAATIGWTTAPQ